MKFPLLGFLIDQPMHGYELKRALSPALPPGRRINDGVLYPLLKRMETEGLIQKRIEPGGKSPDRHVFHATEHGRSVFDEWLRGADEESDEVTYDFLLGHPFLMKCLFFSALTPAQRRAKRRAGRQPRQVPQKIAGLVTRRLAAPARCVAGADTNPSAPPRIAPARPSGRILPPGHAC